MKKLDKLVEKIKNKEIIGGWLKIKISNKGEISDVKFDKKIDFK